MAKGPSAATIAAREKEVKSLLLQMNHEVDALPESALRKLFPILQGARAELERDLRNWLSKLDGSERFTTQQLRVALTQVDGAIRRIEKKIPELRASQKVAAQRAALLARQHLEREAAFFSVRFGGSLQPISLVEAAKVADKTLLDQFDASIAKWPARARQRIRQQLAISLARKETVEQMQRRLVGRSAKYLTPLATQEQKARVVARVLWDKVEVDARRIVRTEVVNAYNSAKLDLIDSLAKEEPGWGKRWDATLDYRTCPFCRSFDGITVGAKENFPQGVEGPPLHPNCRCAVVAWNLGWEPVGSVVRFKGSYAPPEAGERPERSVRTRP